MNKENLQQYAHLERQRREIEILQAEMRECILEELVAEGKEKAVLRGEGAFTLFRRKTWKYSVGVDIARDQLEERRHDEQKDGTATYEEKVTLAFYPNKE